MKPLLLFITLEIIILGILVSSGHEITATGQISSHRAFKIPTTNYSEHDSCHYPVKGGCLTASGTIASQTTIACPRSWKLGTKVIMDGKEYVCEDRYNSNLSDRIDVWAGMGSEAHEKAVAYGVKFKEIIVLK